MLKLQMQSRESSTNDSIASLTRPMSVPFADLVQEVYKYLPEDVCPQDVVPSSVRSYRSGVLSQFRASPKAAVESPSLRGYGS